MTPYFPQMLKSSAKIKVRIFQILVLLTTALTVGCTSLLYYPSKTEYFNPKKYFGVEPEEIYIPTGEDTASAVKPSTQAPAIHAWYFQSSNKNPKGTLIFFHGNAENLSNHYVMLFWILAQGYNFLIFDYPGFDKSIGEATPETTVKSGEQVIQWTIKHKAGPYALYCHSLGGIICLRSYQNMLSGTEVQKNSAKQIKALVVNSSLNSYQRVVRDKLSVSWLTWWLQPLSYVLFSDKFAPEVEKLGPVPKLYIHGMNDPIVPYQFSERMYAASPQEKELWLIEEGRHENTFFIRQGEYQKKLTDYLDLKLKN